MSCYLQGSIMYFHVLYSSKNQNPHILFAWLIANFNVFKNVCTIILPSGDTPIFYSTLINKLKQKWCDSNFSC